MTIRLAKPDPDHLRALRDASRSMPITYSPVGLSSATTAPSGYRIDRWSRELGHGDDVFQRAVHALRHWDVHRGAGLLLCADGPAEIGSVVAMAAPLPIGFIDVVCRVVDVTERPDRVGFAYGTLPVHPEQGEESFTVARHDDTVVFEIVACSRSRHPLARACPPAARALQRAATKRYLDAMQTASGSAL